MSNFKTERKAVYHAANVITELGWFFREQPILDVGIDALIETSNENDPSGNFFAMQIKGGAANFHKTKKGIYYVYKR